MAELKIWTCDRCKKETRSDEWTGDRNGPLTVIGIVRNPGSYSNHPDPALRQAAWCENCMVATGLLKPSSNQPEAAPDSPLSLEDLVREIVCEEIEAQ